MNGMSSRRCEPGRGRRHTRNVGGAAADELLDGDRDERFAEFHEARFDEVVAELLADLVDEFDHDLVAFLEPRTVGEDEDACFPFASRGQYSIKWVHDNHERRNQTTVC